MVSPDKMKPVLQTLMPYLNQSLQNELVRNQRLAERLLETEESVRREVARELHDDIGQTITAIRTQAGIVQRLAPNSASVRQSGQLIEQLSLGVYDSVRRLLGRLRPRQLDDLTLEQAVRSLMREMELEDRGMVSHLAWRIDESLLSENQRVTLFRVCQEGLNNIVKHASASAVTLQGWQQEQRLMLVLEDDGCGLPTGENWMENRRRFLGGVQAGLLLCRRAACNKRFVDDIMVWLRSGILAALFANVALGLFSAILFSTTYIFGLEGSWIEHVWIYALILFETFAGPVLFLMMYDRWAGAECRGTRILDVLLNYIVTPALLIYTAILCLYMVKILVTWSLPEGGWPIWCSGSRCWPLRSRRCSRCCRNACTTGSSTVSAWCRCLRSCCSGSASCVVRTNTGLPNRAYTCLSAAG